MGCPITRLVTMSENYRKKRMLEHYLKKINWLKRRNCFNCEERLDFREFFEANPELGLTRAIELWKYPFLEFYCCDCIEDVNYMKGKLKWDVIPGD